MKHAPHWLVAFALASESLLCTQVTPWHGVVPPPDRTPHKVHFITVEDNVKLEVLDWGGSGRPVVLLTGLGDNAHVTIDLRQSSPWPITSMA